MGRAAKVDVLVAERGRLLSSSATPIDSSTPTPTAMTEEDIQGAILDYAVAARNAIKAGFDLVEIHGANGYLPDQFLQDTCNRRSDSWGGSVANRARFILEVTKAVSMEVGSSRTAVRLSPYSDYLGMLMEDPDPTFAHVVEQLKTMSLAYLHLIEARICGNDDADCGGQKTVKWLVELWDNTSPVLVAGGFDAETAKTAVDEAYRGYDVMIVFGRYFVSNPDLVYRIRSGVSLTKYERTYFYTPSLPTGYIDYPYSPGYLASGRC
jgi:NADPH2 dehydrogenase